MYYFSVTVYPVLRSLINRVYTNAKQEIYLLQISIAITTFANEKRQKGNLKKAALKIYP